MSGHTYANKQASQPRVLITRPGDQGAKLSQALASKGVTAWHCPLMHILPVATDSEPANQLVNLLPNLSLGDLLIAVSRHAVLSARQIVAEHKLSWPTQASYLAVGETTRDTWVNAGVKKVALPESYNSEGLLEHTLCQKVTGKVIIFKGLGGRPVLEQRLMEMGWPVTSLPLYRRQAIQALQGEQLQAWKKRHINTIVVTSVELFESLLDVARSMPGWLDQCRIVVASDRIAREVRNAGHARVTVAESADNQALLQAVLCDGRNSFETEAK